MYVDVQSVLAREEIWERECACHAARTQSLRLCNHVEYVVYCEMLRLRKRRAKSQEADEKDAGHTKVKESVYDSVQVQGDLALDFMFLTPTHLSVVVLYVVTCMTGDYVSTSPSQ